MNPVVDSGKLERAKVWGQSDPSVRWQGAFARFGGNGTTASSTIVYEIEPGGRLGWHTDATEETKYIIAGTGKLHLEDGTTCASRAGQRLRPADADASRSGEHRQGYVAGGCLFCRGDVHANLRSDNDAAEDPCSRHAKSQRPDRSLIHNRVARPKTALRPRPRSRASAAYHRAGAGRAWRASAMTAVGFLLPLQRPAVERRHHRLHVAVVRDVGVRTAIRLGQEWRGRDPLGGERAIDRR